MWSNTHYWIYLYFIILSQKSLFKRVSKWKTLVTFISQLNRNVKGTFIFAYLSLIKQYTIFWNNRVHILQWRYIYLLIFLINFIILFHAIWKSSLKMLFSIKINKFIVKFTKIRIGWIPIHVKKLFFNFANLRPSSILS